MNEYFISYTHMLGWELGVIWVRMIQCKTGKHADSFLSHYNNQGFTPFIKDDKVWLEARNLKHSIVNTKFAPKCEGPFMIVKVLSSITYQLCLPRMWKIHHVFHTSLLTSYKENKVHGQNFLALSPNLIEGKEEYEIEKILHHYGSLLIYIYLIQWKWYLTEEDSWIAKQELKYANPPWRTIRNSTPLSSLLTLLLLPVKPPPIVNNELPFIDFYHHLVLLSFISYHITFQHHHPRVDHLSPFH